MRYAVVILGFVAFTQAHYAFPSLIYNGVKSERWEYTRKRNPTTGEQFPELDVMSENMTCNNYAALPFTELGTKTLDVVAGSSLEYPIQERIIHPGPLQYFLAKVPKISTAKDFDGKGPVWFKIASDSPSIIEERLTWPNFNRTQISVKIPTCVEDGEYLLRVEHIALHNANTVPGAQYYHACSQIKITGGTGTAKPPQMLSFPGSYDPQSESLHLSVWWPPLPTNYTAPGGPVMQC